MIGINIILEKIMDKYIETIKKMIADGQVAQDVAEKYFPELKESEDKRIRNAIRYAIAQSTHSDGNLIECVSREAALAWLEKQGEQKPDEWSEEDEKYFNCAIKYCDEVGYKEGHYAVSNWLRTKFKSLRPQKQWKPTKGQMEALSIAAINSKTDYEILTELLKQLKQL